MLNTPYLEPIELFMELFAESIAEDAALAWLEALGYGVLHGPDIANGEPASERASSCVWMRHRS
mgnify:CR=1 FL=1